MRRWAVAGVALLAGVVALGAAVVSTAPSVPPVATPRSETAVQARALYRRLYAFKNAPGNAPVLTVPQAELDAALRVAGRVAPGLRGHGTITAARLLIEGSMPLPAGLWLNASAAVLPSAEGLALGDLRIGDLTLPPGLALWLARTVGDMVLGNGAAGTVIDAIGPVALSSGRAEIGLALPLAVREAVGARVERAVQWAAVPFDTAPAGRLLDSMEAAVDEGRLRNGGSLVPWLRFALLEAEDGGAALLALAVACGDARISQVAGWHSGPIGVDCSRVQLDKRFDLRKHFVISAGLEIAAALGSAVAVGELKELYDSRPQGSGFSFDDLAANRAGIAFARLVMGSDAAERQRIAERLSGESVLMPAIADLDSGLTDAQFSRLYGDLDSPAYAAAIAEIDRRIAALALYGGHNRQG
jgi:hypothetical protein